MKMCPTKNSKPTKLQVNENELALTKYRSLSFSLSPSFPNSRSSSDDRDYEIVGTKRYWQRSCNRSRSTCGQGTCTSAVRNARHFIQGNAERERCKRSKGFQRIPEPNYFQLNVIRFVLQVSAFSTWEKELHKIVFDPRYLLLTSRERKQVFEKYVKERAEEERREKRNKMRQKREDFRSLMESANLHGKYVNESPFYLPRK